MHGNVPFGVASATEIARQDCRAPTKMSVSYFPAVAKVLWPLNTAAELASIAKKNVRTAERWLTGEFEPPNSIVLAVNQKIFGRPE